MMRDGAGPPASPAEESPAGIWGTIPVSDGPSGESAFGSYGAGRRQAIRCLEKRGGYQGGGGAATPGSRVVVQMDSSLQRGECDVSRGCWSASRAGRQGVALRRFGVGGRARLRQVEPAWKAWEECGPSHRGDGVTREEKGVRGHGRSGGDDPRARAQETAKDREVLVADGVNGVCGGSWASHGIGSLDHGGALGRWRPLRARVGRLVVGQDDAPETLFARELHVLRGVGPVESEAAGILDGDAVLLKFGAPLASPATSRLSAQTASSEIRKARAMRGTS